MNTMSAGVWILLLGIAALAAMQWVRVRRSKISARSRACESECVIWQNNPSAQDASITTEEIAALVANNGERFVEMYPRHFSNTVSQPSSEVLPYEIQSFLRDWLECPNLVLTKIAERSTQPISAAHGWRLSYRCTGCHCTQSARPGRSRCAHPNR